MGFQGNAQRLEEEHFHLEGVPVTGTGAVALNIFKVIGSVWIISQSAVICEITTLANLTDMHADLWDGTHSELLTKATTADLSGRPVGTMFTRDKVATEPYSIVGSTQCGILETASSKRIGLPFAAVQKTADIDTFMRLRFNTTDAPVDFKLNVHFIWTPVDGGSLVLA